MTLCRGPAVSTKSPVAYPSVRHYLGVTPEVRRTDPDGIDYGWVMQMTFLLTIILGVPLVAVLSTLVSLPTWPDRAMFAVQVGAPVWFLTAVSLFLYARWKHTDTS